MSLFVEEILRQRPAAGSGVHSWLFRAARELHAYHNPQEICQLLKQATRGCGRHVPAREIRDAVLNSARLCGKHSEASAVVLTDEHHSTAWPQPDYARVFRLAMNGSGLDDLIASSPGRFESATNNTETLIDQLFPGNPLLCAAKDVRHSLTQSREAWRGSLAACQFIVPSPMSKERGRTQAGRLSARSLDNTCPRRYLVIELDIAKYARDGVTETAWIHYFELWQSYGVIVADVCAAVLCYLAGRWPMALVVSSGGKSLHGWFVAQDRPESDLRRFFRHACYLAADPATWTRSQLVRTPDARRADTGARQQIVYFNPSVLPSL